MTLYQKGVFAFVQVDPGRGGLPSAELRAVVLTKSGVAFTANLFAVDIAQLPHGNGLLSTNLVDL